MNAAITAAVAERERVLTCFLDAEQERIARACHDLARAFAAGGMLIAHGCGAAATDAAHVAVEFMHPVIVGNRALPAVALPNDPTGALTLDGVGRPGDIALALAHGAPEPGLEAFLAHARARGCLTIALLGAGADAVADHVLSVPSGDRDVVQEVQETAYHVLWELVHVFFGHPGLLRDACVTCGDVAVTARIVALDGATAVVEREGAREEVAVELVGEVAVGDRVLCHAGVALERAAPVEDDPTGFLYPFLGEHEDDLDTVLADVCASTLRKGAQTSALRRALDAGAIARAAAAIRARLDAGGRLIAFGNGGSSTDAQDVAADCLARGLPALALTNDAATVTAVANDVGFELAFARQLIALARPADVALAVSTSGSSPNVLAGLEEARRRGLLTCALTGGGGGRLAQLDWLDHLFVVPGEDIPRLQEAHATIWHLLLGAIGAAP
jgi:D-sedoheptulose 7-phosphate isomerase